MRKLLLILMAVAMLGAGPQCKQLFIEMVDPDTGEVVDTIVMPLKKHNHQQVQRQLLLYGWSLGRAIEGSEFVRRYEDNLTRQIQPWAGWDEEAGTPCVVCCEGILRYGTGEGRACDCIRVPNQDCRKCMCFAE